jgi:hypothetical protein
MMDFEIRGRKYLLNPSRENHDSGKDLRGANHYTATLESEKSYFNLPRNHYYYYHHNHRHLNDHHYSMTLK